MSLEGDLQQQFLLRAAAELPTLRLFRRNILKVRVEGRAMRAGIRGQCDLYGYVRGTSRVIEIELKSTTGTLNEHQQRWRNFCIEWGVDHLVLKARKNETVDLTVSRWIQETRDALA